MSRTKSENLVVQSLLDRLTDLEKNPANYTQTGTVKLSNWPEKRGDSLTMYRNGIKRDIEWILNTRKSHIAGIENYKLASNSVLNYGLADLAQFHGAQAKPEALTMTILHTLRTYEPRIIDPQVTLSRTDLLNRSVRFHVDGHLMFDNAQEDISFDTVLETTSGEYEVK